MNDNFSPKAYVAHFFLRDLFCFGEEAAIVLLYKSMYASKDEMVNVSTSIENIISYFDEIDDPVNEFLNVILPNAGIECGFVTNIETNYKRYDREKIQPIENKMVDEKGLMLINSSLFLAATGLKNNASEVIRLGIRLLIESAVKNEARKAEIEMAAKNVISKAQKEKASKPRSKYYDEVMKVIQLTWEKHPAASPTGMHEKLAVHYHGKVSRGALGNWVNSYECRPPKPEKYQRFDLVFPQ